MTNTTTQNREQKTEDFIPVIKFHGFYTEKDITASGTNTFSGSTVFSGDVSGMKKSIISTDATTMTLTEAQSGSVILATKSSGTQTFTLPDPGTEGLIFTFVCGNAGGEIKINPGTGKTIS